MPGRKIIPIPIKKLKGTNRPHREKDVPPPSDKMPSPPAWLNKSAKQIFWHMTARLNEINMASRTNTEMLAVLCSRMEEVERCSKIIDESGMSYSFENSRGDLVMKPRPEVSARQEAIKHVQSLLNEFGLSPASAQKVGTIKKKESARDKIEAFKRRKHGEENQ